MTPRGRTLENGVQLCSGRKKWQLEIGEQSNEGDHKSTRPDQISPLFARIWRRREVHRENKDGGSGVHAKLIFSRAASRPSRFWHYGSTGSFSSNQDFERGFFEEEKEGKVTTDQDRTSEGKDKWKQVPLALKTVIFFWYFFLLCFGFMFYIFLYLKNDYWLKISMNVIVFFYK